MTRPCFEEPPGEPSPAALADRPAELAADGACDRRRGRHVRRASGAVPRRSRPARHRADEWEPLAAGLCQRTRALDASSPTSTGASGSCARASSRPAVVAGATYFEPLMQQAVARASGASSPSPGLDVVRGPDGALPRARGQRPHAHRASPTRWPPATRSAAHLPRRRAGAAGAVARRACGDALRAAAPGGRRGAGRGRAHRRPRQRRLLRPPPLAERLGLPLVRLVDLRLQRRPPVRAHRRRARSSVDVVYRRTDEDRLSHPRGGLTDVAELLLEPWCARHARPRQRVRDRRRRRQAAARLRRGR